MWVSLFVGGMPTIIYSYSSNRTAMGNKISSQTSKSDDDIRNMALRLDLYAQRIILKEVKFNSTLTDSGKCEKLIIITSEVLNRLPFRLISYMDRRHKLFSERYEMINAVDRALLVNTNPEILKESKLDEQNVFRKKQMCVGIARFYVQIGNLFNAIMTTTKPYNYEYIQKNTPDNFYDMLTFGLLDGRESMNKDKQKYYTYNMAGFARRQNDMKTKMEKLLKIGEMDMKISPGNGICSIKKDMEDIKITPMSTTTTASTINENKIKPSIFAMLEELYFDIFHQTSSVNPKSPQFIAMSDDMRNKIYKRDVHELYRLVTGGKEPGDDIKTFADVSRYINDNDAIHAWCKTNKGLEIKVDNTMRYNSTFVKYIKHIQKMNYNISKQRRAIVKILDRVFNVMMKNEDVLHEIEERQGESGFKRYTGFEQDDQYSRDFFTLNLKYDFFINPNLTDAELQVITNEARTRIVRLYADSYKHFLEGFEILQELQENIEVDMMINTKELAKKETENPTTPTTQDVKKTNLRARRILPDEKAFSDETFNTLSNINGDLARKYRDNYEAIYKIASSTINESVKSDMTNKLRNLNLFVTQNITETMNPNEINDEIKRNLLSEIDRYGISKTAANNDQDLARLQLIV